MIINNILSIVFQLFGFLFIYLLTHELILVNEELFVALSFFLCFYFLLFSLSSTLNEVLLSRILDIKKPFYNILNEKNKEFKYYEDILHKYRTFVNQYNSIIKYTLQIVDFKFLEINQKNRFVIDYRFRVLLDDFLLSYIVYMEKIIRAFVKVAHRYFFIRLSKPMYFVRSTPGFSIPRIDVFNSFIKADDVRKRRTLYSSILRPTSGPVSIPVSSIFVKKAVTMKDIKPEVKQEVKQEFGIFRFIKKFFSSLKVEVIKVDKKETEKETEKEIIKSNVVIEKVHPLRNLLPLPYHKTGVWRFLIKSRKIRIWYALFIKNPMLFF